MNFTVDTVVNRLNEYVKVYGPGVRVGEFSSACYSSVEVEYISA